MISVQFANDQKQKSDKLGCLMACISLAKDVIHKKSEGKNMKNGLILTYFDVKSIKIQHFLP